jgi:hypothetical protein
LKRDASDLELWEACQRHEVILVTGNRNQRSADSMEATIQNLSRFDSLPVITLGDPKRFRRDREYAARAAERLLDYLLNFDEFRGTGRLFIP